jgi:hypothetical protein
MLRSVRIAGIAALLAACLGSGLAADADAKRPPACITRFLVDEREDNLHIESPYLVVNTKFWENDWVEEDVPVTVFRTVHVGDVVKAWEADDLDPDDFIGSDKVGRGRGTLIFEGDDAKYLARYQPGAC